MTKLKKLLHIVTLSGLAVAQPIYSIFSNNAEFFVAHDTQPIMLIFLCLVISLVIPILLLPVTLVPGKIGHFSFLGLVSIFTCLMALPLIDQIGVISEYSKILLSATFGISIAILYLLLSGFRLWLTLFSPLVFVFPIQFLFFSPVFSLLFPDSVYKVGALEREGTPPIVLVILDELSTQSLLNRDKGLDRSRYPNFAKLADDGTWYKNASTMGLATTQVVPSILSGLAPYQDEETRLPIVKAYPKNIFTWLRKSYDFNVSERITTLCPDNLCNKNQGEPTSLKGMAIDMAVVYLHRVTPSGYRYLLPDISSNWTGFGFSVMEEINAPRKIYEGERFEKFIHSIKSGEKPSLNVIHSVLPHVPYNYLASGTHYAYEKGVPEGVNNERWSDQEEIVKLGYQRYSQQLAYVDKLLGQLFHQLEIENLYNEALVIVTSDHGVSFQVGLHRRDLTLESLVDVVPVPLIVKFPHQKEPSVDGRFVSNVDILPTIVDVLAVELPWEMAGFSLLSERDRAEILIPFPEPARDLRFSPKDTFSAPHFEKLLGYSGLGKIRPDTEENLLKDFLGQDTKQVKQVFQGQLKIENKIAFRNIDLDSNYLPALLKGEVISDESAPLTLGLAVQNKIVGFTKTFSFSGQQHHFSFLIPEKAFSNGDNKIEVFAITDQDFGLYLQRVVEDSWVFYPSKSILGFLDRIIVRETDVFFTGWAIDVNTLSPASEVYLIIEGEVIAWSKLTISRQDVDLKYNSKEPLISGYQFSIPRKQLETMLDEGFLLKDIQIVAVNAKNESNALIINPKAIAKALSQFGRLPILTN
ncbi:MAG: sulfatase-like hydrolase/transferase [Pseudomonadales bacterium]|nr:sulfatase-like hydrolase/transferase [Pseudomonadales bacterium]